MQHIDKLMKEYAKIKAEEFHKRLRKNDTEFCECQDRYLLLFTQIAQCLPEDKSGLLDELDKCAEYLHISVITLALIESLIEGMDIKHNSLLTKLITGQKLHRFKN